MKCYMIIILVLIILSTPPISRANNLSTPSKMAIGIGFAKDGLQFELIVQSTLKQSLHFAIASNRLWDGSRGEQKDEQLWNYGRKVDGTGDGFYLFDVGWGYIFYSKLRVAAELTFAWDYEYTNYLDARFKDDGYHMIDDKEFQFGLGATASYIFNRRFEIYSGYNTFKSLNAGIRIRF